MSTAVKVSSFCHRSEHRMCATAKARCGCYCHRPRKARKPRPRVVAPSIPMKEQAPCCTAQRDALGRLPIGYCGSDCVRRR